MTLVRNLRVTSMLFMLVTACAGIPQQEMGIYIDAYAQARSATERVLTDLIAAREKIETFKADKAAAENQAEPERRDYVPPTERPSGTGQDAIGTRLAALALVSQYNDILVAIAEGKRVETLQAKVQGATQAATQLLSLAGASLPGVGALTGLLQTIAGAVQKYEDRRAFAEAIKEGAPLVKEILHFFIKETPEIVKVHEGIWDAQGAILLGQANRVARTILSEAKQWGPPAAGSNDEKRVKKIETRMTEQLTRIRRGEVKLDLTGANPITTQTLSRLEANLGGLETAVAAYVENQKKSPALRALMNQYVGTLATTQLALDHISEALDRPVDFSQIAVELLESAIAIKQQYAVYKAALNSP